MRVSAKGYNKYSISGDYSEEVTPVPISNTVVKLLCADDTWWEAAWESRTLPVFYLSNTFKSITLFYCHIGKIWYNNNLEDYVMELAKLLLGILIILPLALVIIYCLKDIIDKIDK